MTIISPVPTPNLHPKNIYTLNTRGVLRIELGEQLSPEALDKMLARQREIGEIAEKLVYEYERKKLQRCGKHNLVELIDWVSKKNCAAGYDIRSFDQDGNPIYIEVKGTSDHDRDCFAKI